MPVPAPAQPRMPQEAEPAPLPVSAPDLPTNSRELDGWEAEGWEAAMAEMRNLPTWVLRIACVRVGSFGKSRANPHVMIELLSPATAKVDRGLKKQLYPDTFRTLEYFWFDPNTLECAGFHLVAGTYQPIATSDQGWLWSQQLQLYLGIYQEQLQFFTPTGELVPTPEETAETERQRAEFAQQQVDLERQRNQRLMAQLRALGVDPDQAV